MSVMKGSGTGQVHPESDRRSYCKWESVDCYCSGRPKTGPEDCPNRPLTTADTSTPDGRVWEGIARLFQSFAIAVVRECDDREGSGE